MQKQIFLLLITLFMAVNAYSQIDTTLSEEAKQQQFKIDSMGGIEEYVTQMMDHEIMLRTIQIS